MSAGHQTLRPPDLTQQSLMIRFSPQFLRKISEYLLVSPESQGKPIFGLLLGAAGERDVVIQSLRLIQVNSSREEFSSAGDWGEAFEQWRRHSYTNPELTWLDPVGWFCFRSEDSRGLRATDAEFHNAYFHSSNDLAAIFHFGAEARISAQIYAGSLNSPLYVEDHRRGSLYFSAKDDLSLPVKVTLRERVRDDSYLRTYQVVDALNRAETWAEWKDRVRSILWLKWP